MTLNQFQMVKAQKSRHQRNIFNTQEMSLKKIYDEVTEDIFDMSNVRTFKEIEKKKWEMFILCYVFGQLSSVKRLA